MVEKRQIHGIEEIILVQSIPLIPHGELIPAQTIDLTSTSRNEIKSMHKIGNAACHDRFFAVAGTQLPDSIFNIFDANPNLNNFIYFPETDDTNLSNKLLINPKAMPQHGVETVPVIEACGSINSGKSIMIVQRPTSLSISAWVADSDGNISNETYTVAGFTSAILQHELVHLEGKTALDYPEKLIDHRKLTSEQILRMDAFASKQVFAYKRVQIEVEFSPLLKWVVPHNGGWTYENLTTI